MVVALALMNLLPTPVAFTSSLAWHITGAEMILYTHTLSTVYQLINELEIEKHLVNFTLFIMFFTYYKQ